MKIKKSRIYLFVLFICIFCFAYLYVNSSSIAQYSPYNYYNYNNNNYYYEYSTQALSPSYFYGTPYSNSYSWVNDQYYGREINIPTLKINDWSIQPNFGNTVYSVSSNGSSLTIYGTYFSAHTHAGVNFNRTLFMDSSLSSSANHAMYNNIGGQSSLTSPVSYYARQVLQFSPVLHGPLLNNY
ncbi:MAG: hypothetical protein ACMUHX_00105 [bacterium]